MFKRALVAASVAAVFAAPAFADVKISGSVEMNLLHIDYKNGAIKDSQQFDRGIIISFDGSDKLDSGSSLIWRVSQKIAEGNQTPGWGSREAYVGFTGDWGTFKAGRQFLNSYLVLDWPYGQGGNWQLAENSWHSPAAAGKLTAVLYPASSLNYQSPNFGGFSFGVQHAWDLNDNVVGGAEKGSNAAWNNVVAFGDENITDLSAAFSTGSLNVNAGYLFGNDISSAGSKERQFYVGATYGFDFGLSVRALYTGYDSKPAGGTKQDGHDWIIGGTYAWDKSFVKASWHQFDADNKADDGNIGSIEYGYGLSKNTVGYVRYQNRDKGAGDLQYFMVGVWSGF